MLDKFYSQFKSGTDIRGVASEGVDGQNINLTDEVIERITSGFVKWLEDKTTKASTDLVVSVGRDSRISGPRISSVVCNTLTSYGVTVLNCGLASTPSMFMTTIDLECDGAIEITASHHPFNRNGLKFFTKNGGLEATDISIILENAQNNIKVKNDIKGTLKEVDYMSSYAKRLQDMIKKEVNSNNYDRPLEGFKIVVDAGNGVGGFYADKVLAKLGANITGSQFLNPDGMFPNHIPNPEDKKAMESICNAVKANNADMGVIFDTDVDRGAAVDDKGEEISRNTLVAIASVIALEGNDGGTIVTDSITSSGLKEYIEVNLGGKHCRYKRGYKNVINKAIELNNQGVNCPLAIETSGHAALRENYFLDDGAYLCTKIIIKMAQLKKEGANLDSLIKPLKKPLESTEKRIKITEENFKDTGLKILKDLEEYAKTQSDFIIATDSAEGVRVSFDSNNGSGWFLLRLSVHDPIMPLNIESDIQGGVDVILNKISKYLKSCSGIDISML